MDINELILLPKDTIIEAWKDDIGRMFEKIGPDDRFEIVEITTDGKHWHDTNAGRLWLAHSIIDVSNDALIIHGVKTEGV